MTSHEPRPVVTVLTTRPLEWDRLGPLFHEDCGYLWKLHDNRVAGRALPFGCPSEAEARAAWGDR